MKKIRLDIVMSEKGLSRSRERAKREIMSGWVRVNGETVRDPSKTVASSDEIRVERPGGVFVSRGGDKLAHALDRFSISLEGKTAVDMGASTGGFTDCMLKSGARKVYAVDVGYGQLDYSLQSDPRVFVMDRTNVKNLQGGDIPDPVDFITADLSFISILKVFEHIKHLFSPVDGIILLKPQFEAQPGEHKKGVVRKKDIHREILTRVIHSLKEMGMTIKGLVFSPIKGPSGNIEFLLYFTISDAMTTDECSSKNIDALIDTVVEEAHATLNK